MLVWAPILFTIVTSIAGTLRSGMMRFDFLMPAELFPLALGGALLLLWAALWARFYRKRVIMGLSAVILFLVGGQALAVISGLASGAVAPTGWVWAAVVASIAVYSLAVAGLGVVGIMLIIRLFHSERS